MIIESQGGVVNIMFGTTHEQTEADLPLPFETAVVENETFAVTPYSNLAFYDQIRNAERKLEADGFFRSSTSLSHAEFESFFDIVKYIGKDNFKIAEAPVAMYNGQTIEIKSRAFKELSEIEKHFSDAVAGHRTIYLYFIGKMMVVDDGMYDENFNLILDKNEQPEIRYDYKIRYAVIY
jgi:hypothetical protein